MYALEEVFLKLFNFSGTLGVFYSIYLLFSAFEIILSNKELSRQKQILRAVIPFFFLLFFNKSLSVQMTVLFIIASITEGILEPFSKNNILNINSKELFLRFLNVSLFMFVFKFFTNTIIYNFNLATEKYITNQLSLKFYNDIITNLNGMTNFVFSFFLLIIIVNAYKFMEKYLEFFHNNIKKLS